MTNPLRLTALALSLLVAGGAFAQDDVKKKPKFGSKTTAKGEADEKEEPKKKAKGKVEGEEEEKKGNLPPIAKAGKVNMRPGWKQLELDAKQLKQYEKVSLEFKAKIDDLDAKLDKAKEQRDEALEAILTPVQMKKLKEYKAKLAKGRKEAARKRVEEEEMEKEKAKADKKHDKEK